MVSNSVSQMNDMTYLTLGADAVCKWMRSELLEGRQMRSPPASKEIDNWMSVDLEDDLCFSLFYHIPCRTGRHKTRLSWSIVH